jgi:hypothetical protein
MGLVFGGDEDALNHHVREVFAPAARFRERVQFYWLARSGERAVVENGDDLGTVRLISVGNDVRYAWHDKFPGASDAAKTAEIGPFSEEVDGVKQCAGDSIGGLGIVAANLRAKVSQVFDRARRPDDDHARATFRSRLWPHERSHFATALCGTQRPSSRSVSPF